MTDRRKIVGSLALAPLAAPLAAVAQQSPKLRRIGLIGNAGPESDFAKQLSQGLHELGWVEGQTLTIEHRWAEGHSDRVAGLAAELVQAKVDVLVVSGPLAMAAAQKATRSIPIVFVVLVDPVTMGFVRSLARPGGNMTGLASQFDELITKQLQLLKEAVPRLARVAFLRHSESSPTILRAVESAARSLGLSARTLTVTQEAEFERAFQTARDERVGAVHVLPSPFLGARRARVIELAAHYRLPAFYELRFYVEDGGLMSYGPSIRDMYGRSASYVDRILKGANPGDLAIERPAKFELVINQKTATALGLAIPQSLLNRADEVIL